MILPLLLAAALLVDPAPPPPEPPLGVPPGPQPVPALQALAPDGLTGTVVTQIDTMCDHGNRIYRWMNTSNIPIIPPFPQKVFLVPKDPTCPGGL